MSVLVAACLFLQPAPTQTVSLQKLRTELDQVAKYFPGRLGYSVTMLDTGERISFRGDERFPTASTIKTAVALHAIREVDAGRLKWSDKRELPPASKRGQYDASMWTYHMKDGMTLDLDAYVNLMITVSDNLATRVLREWLGSVEINRSMSALGLKDTLSLSSVPDSETRLRRLNGQFGLGVTTPNEMGRLLELVYRRQAASPAGCEKLIRVMSHQYWDDWIGASVPPGIAVASKSGAISRSRSDTAIVFAPRPYVLTIFTDNQKDRRWAADNAGDMAIRKLAVLVWNGTQRQKYTPPKGFEKFLPTGGGVEDS